MKYRTSYPVVAPRRRRAEKKKRRRRRRRRRRKRKGRKKRRRRVVIRQIGSAIFANLLTELPLWSLLEQDEWHPLLLFLTPTHSATPLLPPHPPFSHSLPLRLDPPHITSWCLCRIDSAGIQDGYFLLEEGCTWLSYRGALLPQVFLIF